MGFKQTILGLLSRRQRERIRHHILSGQIARGQPTKEKEIELIRQLVGAGDYAIDIGANVGQFTRELSLLVGPKGHVYSFEPVGNNYEILETVKRKAKLGNVSAFHRALGARPGTMTMVIPSTDSFAGYYLAHFDVDGAEDGRRETVTTTTLDTLHSEKTIVGVDFIKCDVEGAEVDVLQGGMTMIRALKPGFMVEVSRATSAACFELFRELGYVAYVYDGKARAVDSYQDGHFSNYFFIHPTSKCMTRLRALAGVAPA